MSKDAAGSALDILQRMWSRFPQIFAIAIAVLIWWAVARFELVGRTLVASPLEVWQVLVGGPDETSPVWFHALHTFKRAIQGWTIALLIGTILGLLIGRARILFIGGEPLIEFVRSVPPVIIFPLLLVVFNYDTSAYVWTIVLGCTPVMILAVARRLQQISEAKIELLKLYNVGWPIRWIVMSMEIMPGLFFGSRVMLSIAIVISVVTEMVIAPRAQWALGKLVMEASMAFQTADYFAALLIIGVFGYVSNSGLRLLEGWIGSSAELDKVRSPRPYEKADPS